MSKMYDLSRKTGIGYDPKRGFRLPGQYRDKGAARRYLEKNAEIKRSRYDAARERAKARVPATKMLAIGATKEAIAPARYVRGRLVIFPHATDFVAAEAVSAIDAVFSNIALADYIPEPSCVGAVPGTFIAGPRIFDGGVCPVQTENHDAQFWEDATTTGAGSGAYSEWYKWTTGFGQFWYKQTKQWADLDYPPVLEYPAFAEQVVGAATVVGTDIMPEPKADPSGVGNGYSGNYNDVPPGYIVPAAHMGPNQKKPVPGYHKTVKDKSDKVKINVGIVGNIASAVTEAKDIAGAIANAIPGKPCRNEKTLQGLWGCILENVDKIDYPQATVNFVKMELTDRAIGALGKFGARGVQNAAKHGYYRSPVGLSTGGRFTQPPNVRMTDL